MPTTQEAVCEVSRDPPARSFSSAIVPLWRDQTSPEGQKGLREEQREKVRADNALSWFCAQLARSCAEAGLSYLVGNPLRSRMWRMLEWKGLGEKASSFLVDTCRLRTVWRKASRLATNGQLRSLPLP